MTSIQAPQRRRTSGGAAMVRQLPRRGDDDADFTGVEAPVGEDEVSGGIRAGDSSAMAELYDRHGSRIYNYCYRRTASWSEAQDLTSEVFLTAWRTRERAAQPDEALLPWLYAIASNLLRNHLRSQRRGRSALTRLPVPDHAAAADEVLERLDGDERVRRALARLAEFPTTHQEVFWLVVWEELSYEQAAEALGCPVGTVRSRLSRVRQALRLSDEASHE